MKKSICLLLLLSISTYAQIGIGTTSPDPSAILDITASDKGVLIPRINLIDVTNIISPINAPATGLMIWNTNASVTGGTGIGFYYFNGTQWTSIASHTLDDSYDEGGPGVGRTIIADASPVRIDGSDGLWITGTHGSGSILEPSTTNSKMFFYPRKSAFRAGFDDTNSWIDSAIGEYSAAFGRNTIASGTFAFAAGEQNVASGTAATTFGTFNTSSGATSFTTGNTNTASGSSAFAMGNNSIASGDVSFTAGNNLEAPSFAEVAFGSFNTTYIPNSATSFDSNDRLFSIGYGSGSSNRKDAIEVYKNGQVRINNAYNFPLTDGLANQVLTTDGAGNLNWTAQSNDRNITSIPIYAANATQTMNNTGSFALITGCRSAIIPTNFNSLGNVQVKCVIRYTAVSGAISDNQFQIRVNDGVTNTNIISETDTWNNTTTANGGVYESEWKAWDNATAVYQVILRGQAFNSASMDVANVYLMVKSQ